MEQRELPDRKCKKPKLNLNVTFSKIPTCKHCKQQLNSVLIEKLPKNSTEEIIAIQDERLSLHNENNEKRKNEIQSYKITNFNIYDMRNHSCSLDENLIEQGVKLYCSGYLKPIYDEDSSHIGGVPVCNIGPITEWWTAGFDGGEKILVGIDTDYAEYYLMQPSEGYRQFWKSVENKAVISKIVLEFLMDFGWKNPTYEEFLEHVNMLGNYNNAEQILMEQVEFLCTQISSFDGNARKIERPLLSLECVQTYIRKSGLNFNKSAVRKATCKVYEGISHSWGKATITKLVYDIFNSSFERDYDEVRSETIPLCGICDNCQLPDCGECQYCRVRNKDGWCANKECSYNTNDESDEDVSHNFKREVEQTPLPRNISKRILFRGGPVREYKYKKFYSVTEVGNIVIGIGDYVELCSAEDDIEYYIARVVHMYETHPEGFMMHGQLFLKGINTILGEVADPKELFAVDICIDTHLGNIISRVEVILSKELWLCNLPDTSFESATVTYFLTKKYIPDESRFEDYIEDDVQNSVFSNCESCRSEKMLFFHSIDSVSHLSGITGDKDHS